MARPENLLNEEVENGESVAVTRSMNLLRMNTNDYYDVTEDQELIVTRVYNGSLVVRTLEPIRVRTAWGGSESKHASFQIDRMFLTDYDPARRPRRLGEKPEDTESQTYIDKLDPGIQWLWEDLGRYADEQGWCPQYDALTARIGIPGRPRDFTVNLDLNGVRFSATVQARSQREANERAEAAVATSLKADVVTAED